MASIENRSHYEVSVKHRDDLTKTFAHSAKKSAGLTAPVDSMLTQPTPWSKHSPRFAGHGD